jgi:hypothetical protein
MTPQPRKTDEISCHICGYELAPKSKASSRKSCARLIASGRFVRKMNLVIRL